MLLFADDVTLFADTVRGLQIQLNILQDYCANWSLEVNMNKTEIVVCKRGGMLSKKEKWTFKCERVKCVSGYNYLGTFFSSRLSYSVMVERLDIKAKRAFMSTWKSTRKFGTMSSTVYFKIFNMQIRPILLYACELWGFQEYESIEKIQLYAIKRFMTVGSRACNSAVLGDCGRFPLYISTQIRCIKYWLKLLHMDDNRYVRKCYNMLMYYDSLGKTNWVTNIRQLLQRSGFSFGKTRE